MTKLVALNEIVGAVHVPSLSNEQISALKADAIGFLSVNLNIELEGDISVVENSSSDVHLTLPYYSMVEELQTEMLKDEKLADIVGGEIIISLLVFAGAGVGFLIAGAAGTVGLSSMAIIGVSAAIGGAVGLGIAGTAIHGGINASEGKDFMGNKK